MNQKGVDLLGLAIKLKNAHKMITEARLDKRRNTLFIRFADGVSGEIPVRDLKDADLLDWSVMKLASPYSITIGIVGSKQITGIPWDFARAYCDPLYANEVKRRGNRDRKILANNLKQFRAVEGWSQGELSEKSGVSRITISRLENQDEQSPRFETLEKLAAALKIELAELFSPSVKNQLRA